MWTRKKPHKESLWCVKDDFSHAECIIARGDMNTRQTLLILIGLIQTDQQRFASTEMQSVNWHFRFHPLLSRTAADAILDAPISDDSPLASTDATPRKQRMLCVLSCAYFDCA